MLIIKEMFLPPHQRRIQQRTAELGGVAGGEKFLHSNIFFKLAVDRGGLYGGDAYAKKAAEHELKGASFTPLWSACTVLYCVLRCVVLCVLRCVVLCAALLYCVLRVYCALCCVVLWCVRFCRLHKCG